jgi:hypothetical protein
MAMQYPRVSDFPAVSIALHEQRHLFCGIVVIAAIESTPTLVRKTWRSFFAVTTCSQLPPSPP